MSVTERIPNSNERGFTIVEVIVVAVIVAIVAVGAVGMFRSAGKASNTTKLRAKMYTAAQTVGESLRSEKVWLDEIKDAQRPAWNGCLGSSGCALGRRKKKQIGELPMFQPEGTGIEKVDLRASVRLYGVDSPSDGTGKARDKDSQWPDYYRATITVTVNDATLEEYPNLRPLTYQTIIDPLSIGRLTGSLTIQFCKTSNQVDDRIVLADCSRGAEGIKMERQPECTDGVRESFYCNKAVDQVRGSSKGEVQVSPAHLGDVRFWLQRCADRSKDVCDGEGRIYEERDGTCSRPEGTCLFTGLPTGQYRVIRASYDPAGAPEYEEWQAKNIPAGRYAAVEPAETSRAMVVFRPVQARNALRVGFARSIKVATVSGGTGSGGTLSFGGFPTSLLVTRYTIKWERVDNVPGPARPSVAMLEPKPFGRFTEADEGSSTLSIKPKMTPCVGFTPLASPPGRPGAVWTEIPDLPTGLVSGTRLYDCGRYKAQLCVSYNKRNPSSCVPEERAEMHYWMPVNRKYGGPEPIYYDYNGECYQTGAIPWRRVSSVNGECSRTVLLPGGHEVTCGYPSTCTYTTGVVASGGSTVTGCCSSGPVPGTSVTVSISAPSAATSSSSYTGPSSQTTSV